MEQTPIIMTATSILSPAPHSLSNQAALHNTINPRSSLSSRTHIPALGAPISLRPAPLRARSGAFVDDHNYSNVAFYFEPIFGTTWTQDAEMGETLLWPIGPPLCWTRLDKELNDTIRGRIGDVQSLVVWAGTQKKSVAFIAVWLLDLEDPTGQTERRTVMVCFL